jgi:SulP family sulfate permease
VLPGDAVTVLQIYGNLAFAAADRVEALLPAVGAADRPVAILRLRSHDSLGSTFLNVLQRYARQLAERGGRLLLAGVTPHVKQQLDDTGFTTTVLGEAQIFPAGPALGAATTQAMDAAQAWLIGGRTSATERAAPETVDLPAQPDGGTGG